MGVWNPGPGATAGDDAFTGDATSEIADGLAGDDFLSGGAGDDALSGNIGDDTLDGGAGDDLIDGGAGRDMASYASAPGPVVVDLRLQGSGQVVSGAGIDTLLNIEGLAGSAFDDILIGDNGDNTLTGGHGDDQISGGGGSDILRGEDGDDTFLQLPETGVDTISGGSGFDTLRYTLAAGVVVQLSGYATTSGATLLTLFSGIEGAVGTSFDDALIGDSADNYFQGGGGADWIVGAGGDDIFDQERDPFAPPTVDRLFGDAGFDTIDFHTTAGGPGDIGVVVQLSGYATSQEGQLLALFSGLEGAIGTVFDDALIGTGANNRLTGAAGSDWLVGQGGDDWFVQGTEAGVDRLFGDAGLDTIDYSAAGVGVTVQLNGWSTISGGATLATFTGIENAVGSGFNDALIGSAANNRIEGGAGADWLVGGAGDDTFVYQALESTRDSIRDFTADDLIDLSAIDADPTTPGADDDFVFATVRHAGVVGEAVVATVGISSLVSLYLDGDNFADMTIQLVHQSGFVMSAGDFVL